MDQQLVQPIEPNSQFTPEPPARNNRRLALMLSAIVATVIAVIVLAAALLGGDEPTKSSSASNASQPKSQLAPKTELKVGVYRYVSPCQVLPLASVTKVMGSIAADGYVQEDSLATNYELADSPVRTHCDYTLNRDTDLLVGLSAEQYTDASKLKRVRSVFISDPDALQQLITAYRQDADKSKNKQAQAFVSKFEKSITTYKKYADVYSETELQKFNPNGIILPGYLKAVGYIYNNVYYTLDVAGYDAKQLTVDQMAKLNGLLTIVANNAQNKQLDQSPASTYLNNTTKVGSTKLLEPCTLLTSAKFTEISGVAENNLLNRLSLPAQPGKEQKRSDSSTILPTNICERTASTGNRSQISVELQIKYASSTAQAQAEYAKYNNSGSAEAALQTSADEAKIVGADVSGAGFNSYVFIVGPYFATVTISNIEGGNITYANKDQHLKAINILAERLKTANR